MKWYRVALAKAYFDQGYALLSYPKYILILAGVGSLLLTSGESTSLVVVIGVLIGIGCFVIGRWMFKSGFVQASIEVQNQVNAFVQEMRKVFKSKN